MTRFWMIRHALVAENARLMLYGTMDVELCADTLIAEAPSYRALAQALPQPASWVITPLSRTARTAQAIMQAGYPKTPMQVEPGLIEQDLGEWQGLPHAELPAKLQAPPHPFWPLAGDERPPGGESMAEVIVRVGAAVERLAEAHPNQDVVIIAHGGSIRAAVAHALHIGPDNALHLSIQNISLTRLERLDEGWRVVCVNTVQIAQR